ncbi:MAG: hypothetical protein JW751_03955 [Polyangiaceae bacterium]|nr:hypothetical protein [Polyangiaceae bacterium]
MTRIQHFAIAVLGALAFACTEDVDSTDVRTSGVYAEMEVVAAGDGESRLTVRLSVGGDDSNTYLEMAGDDELVATDGDRERELGKSGTSYRTTFDTEAGGTEFTVSFNRGPDDDSAPDSHGTLPDPFEIDEVPSRISRAESIVITYGPSDSDDDMEWSIDGDCMFRNGDDMSDSGTLELSANDYDVVNDDEDESCTATLCFERSREGEIDPAFGEGGEFIAIQRRCVSFTSTP